jgi:hypothetical protein
MEAQSHITAFINDQLDMATLKEFLSHVNQCAECREELEVYYALLTAMKLLDEDKELSDNFNHELSHKLKLSADKLRRMKIASIRRKFSLMMVVLGFIIVSSVMAKNVIILPVKPPKPSFLLGYSVIPSYLSPMNRRIEEYDLEARSYTARRREVRFIIYQQLEQNQLMRAFGNKLVISDRE